MPAMPSAPGPAPRRARAALVPADAIRGVGVLSVLVALIWRGPVDAALFSMVLAGLMVPRLLRLPGPLDVGYGIGILVAAWCGALGVYEQVGWSDLAVHFAVTGVVAAVAYLALVRLEVVRDPAAAGTARHRAGIAIVTACLGLALSALWELAEWSGHTYLDETIYVGYVDTIGDMAVGGLGSLIAGVLLTSFMSPRRAGDRGGPPSAATAGSAAS